MEIKRSIEIDSFMNRCMHNIHNDYKNQFLGYPVTKQTEQSVIQKLKKAGFAEWDSTPTLFLSTDEWESNPYHQNIHLDRIQDNHFTYLSEPVYGNELFNYDVIQKDPKRELNDYMKLRAMDRNFNAIYLLQDDEDWMMDVPSEAATNDPYAKKAYGNVLTFGLGIGYYLYMALQNPSVKSITVVEKQASVIQMFKKYLLPQFPSDKEIHIIQGDAFHLWNKAYIDQFDYVYVDIWQSNDDGLYCINKLLEIYNPPFDKADFWIEDSCYEILWTLNFLFFKEIYTKKKVPVSPEYQWYKNKLINYYKSNSSIITTSDELKDLMYDTSFIRDILSTR